MAKIDNIYNNLLNEILTNGKSKGDRTGTGTRSIFHHTLEYDMEDGFPLLTTKKMFLKGIITELLWFLNGSTDLRELVEQGNNIWVGDAHKRFLSENVALLHESEASTLLEGHVKNGRKKDDFIELIKTNDEFNKKWGDLGPIYGKQWVKWDGWKTKPSIGWLHKRDNIWCVKWSDTHSFSHGTDWLYTNIIDSDQSKYGESDEGREVTYKRTTIDYNKETFVPNEVATVVDYTVGYEGGTNQIQNAIDLLNDNPDSRRIMVSAWNPTDIPNMILPPCHWAFELYTEELTLDERIDISTFYYKDDVRQQLEDSTTDTTTKYVLDKLEKQDIPKRRLSLKWHQRSVDVGLGLGFNIASYAFLLEMFAQQVNMVPGMLVGDLTNVHIYNDHIEQVTEQLGRSVTEHRAPTLKLNKADDMFSYKLEDFSIEGYESYPTIKMPLSN